jgi:pimeloyl-ACP methyl ester carboxylesterase
MQSRTSGAAVVRSRGWHGAWCWDEHFLDFFAEHGFRAAAVSLRAHGKSATSQRLSDLLHRRLRRRRDGGSGRCSTSSL